MDLSQTPTLENTDVRLVALSTDHSDELAHAVGDLWRIWYTSIPAPDHMGAEIKRRLALQQQQLMAPWAIVDPSTNRAIGMTTFMDIDPINIRLEIGSTWLSAGYHGKRINPAMKLLLLERAFDILGCIAVEFRTHWHNRQSRAAIEKLGAKQDGVLRNHKIMPNGTIRDTVVYSILDNEWPTVRAGLESRLNQRS